MQICGFEGSIVVFDDTLDFNQEASDPSLTTGRHRVSYV